MQDFEKLGAFYLGKRYDMERGEVAPELLLYDAKDLTTHAVCVGMTGSGKTGLCLSLLEEAAIDGIPTIAIDPKGDLGNLLLAFPELQPSDFRPWVDEGEAARQGMTVEQFSKHVAKTWREGLAAWGQDGERIARFRAAADVAIYTPGSNAGLGLTPLSSFAAPAAALIDDSDALRQRVTSTASGILALLGIEADPIRSREHILIANLLEKAWRGQRDLDIAGLIGAVQEPPFDKLGVIDLETFFPAKDRLKLAMAMNNLLASPSFANWMEGEPLNIQNLLYAADGRPRISIVSIAHLSDAERMFFVTILLNEILAWVRCQPGTASLRALLYMDEVFGYFPPTANPPSKTPMLTLLKQARAYGLGVVLATQNPVDLDYKGLSNAGTWFLGRLQTERDKLRVLEGLEGASVQAGATFDRGRMEATLAGLGSRVFLMNNVHEDQPVVFQTRWALSYLRGPLTRGQIQTLMSARKKAEPPAATPAAPAPPALEAAADNVRPGVPDGVEELFAAVEGPATPGTRLVYQPALLGSGKVHYIRATYHVDFRQTHTLLAQLSADPPDSIWTDARAVDQPQLDLRATPDPDVAFAALPPALVKATAYRRFATQLKKHLYTCRPLLLWRCRQLKAYSTADEDEVGFRIRLRQIAHEERDRRVEKLRRRYSTKLRTLRDRSERARQRVAREKSEYRQKSLETAVSFGSTILGALFGRKLASRTNVDRASQSAKGLGRAARQRDDVGEAEHRLEAIQEDLLELEAAFKAEAAEVGQQYDVANLELEELRVRPRKSEIEIERVALVWLPRVVDTSPPGDFAELERVD